MDIDNYIAKLYLEGGGGGSYYESYEFSAYFYSMLCELKNPEIPFFFLTGDEAYYEKIPVDQMKKVIYAPVKSDINSKERFGLLMKKYNVFLIKKPYEGPNEEKIMEQWASTLGEERILMIQHPKACIDVMLGAIALTTGARDLEGYVEDMRKREQTEDRITEVVKSLKLYNDKLVKKECKIVLGDSITDLPERLSGFELTNFKEINSLVSKFAKQDLVSSVDERKDLTIMKKAFKNDVPNEFICPITEEVFTDPVMTCDGHTYERKAIEAWLSNHDTSPVTNLHLNNKNLIPNTVLKNLIKNLVGKK
jgi:hypothetical protein